MTSLPTAHGDKQFFRLADGAAVVLASLCRMSIGTVCRVRHDRRHADVLLRRVDRGRANRPEEGRVSLVNSSVTMLLTARSLQMAFEAIA